MAVKMASALDNRALLRMAKEAEKRLAKGGIPPKPENPTPRQFRSLEALEALKNEMETAK